MLPEDHQVVAAMQQGAPLGSRNPPLSRQFAARDAGGSVSLSPGIITGMVMDGSSHLTRRLAAVAFADVAGYSLLVAADDTGTQRRWKALRTEVLEPQVRQQRGRVVDTAGDAL